MVLCDDVCYVMMHDGIRDNICDVLPIVIQNVYVKRNKNEK